MSLQILVLAGPTIQVQAVGSGHGLQANARGRQGARTKNARSAFTACTVALLTAFTPGDQFVSTGSRSCQTIEVPACSNNPKDPVVRVQYRRGRGDFLFLPPSVCVEAGETVELALEALPEQLRGSAAILPKNAKDTWLVGTNADDVNRIRVLVPEWADDGNHD